MDFREKINFWKSNIKFIVWAIVGLASLWAITTNHFVLAADHEAFKKEVGIQNITTEESMVLMQIMMQEDRLRSAIGISDQGEIEIIKGRLNLLRMRSAALEAWRLEKKKGR